LKQEDTRPTTKACPECGNTHLALFGRENEKICVDCDPHVRIPWYLTEGQKEDYK
jgi:hypothetical protein